jgi:uncharacterized DUF497 family protein
MFEWDETKDRANRLKHDVSFETAALVFDDPYSLTQRDSTSEEERFITLGAIGPGAVLFVVHLSYENTEREEIIRIISARSATAREKKSYEEAYKKAEGRDRASRRQARRRH